MLLLYILWDDWPIFMISGSNEQLQQQLEYTLLKPDCHSWWISKMQSGCKDTLEEQYAIKFCFKLGKDATETYGMLHTAFRPCCMNRASVFEWHKRFLGKRPALFKSGQWHFHQDNTPVHNSILVTDYLTKMGINTVPQPPNSPDLAPCDFWLFPKLRGCRYETIEEIRVVVTKIIDTLTEEDFHGHSRSCWNGTTSALQPEEITSKGTSFMCVLSIKVPIRKKSLETYLVILINSAQYQC